MSGKRVAFFDIDGTLFRWSLFLFYVDRMVERGILPESIREEYEDKLILWQNRDGDFTDYVNTVVEAFENNLRGVRVDDFLQCVQEVVDENSKKTYVFTRNFIKKLKDQDYYVIAISHSAKLALDKFCPMYGFDKVYGMMYEIDTSGRFTGEILNENEIKNKASIVKRAVEKEKLSLKDSIAIGDTGADISMLEMVERPIAFNPNRELYEHAVSSGWEIVVERKDVIYNISP